MELPFADRLPLAERLPFTDSPLLELLLDLEFLEVAEIVPDMLLELLEPLLV